MTGNLNRYRVDVVDSSSSSVGWFNLSTSIQPHAILLHRATARAAKSLGEMRT